jgi:hypothetical protein
VDPPRVKLRVDPSFDAHRGDALDVPRPGPEGETVENVNRTLALPESIRAGADAKEATDQQAEDAEDPSSHRALDEPREAGDYGRTPPKPPVEDPNPTRPVTAGSGRFAD